MERQTPLKEFLLKEHLEGVLSCMFEMTQYSSSLQVCPVLCAGLACPSSSRFDVETVKAAILTELQMEWELVLSSETEPHTATVLHRTCAQTKWQCYRELMTVLEMDDWKLSDRSLSLIQAWLPALNSSANIEDIFNSMADSISRSTKTDMASMTSLQAVQIRAYQQKLVGLPTQPKGVQLTGTDFEGHEIRGLKPKLFQPASFTGSTQADISIFSVVYELGM